MAESSLSAVLGSVASGAVQETKFLCAVTLEVDFLKAELVRLQCYIKDADSKWRSGNARVAVLVSQIRDVAYEAQNAIEAADYMEKRNRLKRGFMGAISRFARLPSDLATLRDIGVEVRRVRRKLSEIFASAEYLQINLDTTVVVEFLHDCNQMHPNFEDDLAMVGFDDEHEEIVDKLVDNENMLSAVSIVAMGGAGKTTLAKKVYTSSRVKQHFDVFAWVTVSQTFKSVDVLKDIMKQILEDKDQIKSIDQMEEYEVGKKLRDYLVQKRYLIVLDDVWEVDTWDQLNMTAKSFPDAASGSRVLLTTRKVDVANHVQMPTHVHALKHLDEEKSLELFHRKALPAYKRSVMSDLDEFEKIGRKLARKCDGLPLALTVLGGYLSRNLNTQSWSDVLLGWPSTKNVDTMRNILARSYKDLKDRHLRSCLLYLAAFPEDYIIDVSALIALWIAEGFVPHAPRHEQEETARMYIAELSQRCLVQVAARSVAHGWIEKIRVHDILRDWCIEEAKQDGFFHVIHKTLGQVCESSVDVMASYRSSYQSFSGPNMHTIPNLRTLTAFQLPPISLPELRFLRVLHIENSRLKDFSRAIGVCIHLRCLRLINCQDVTLPASIGKLLYLHTIDMTNTYVRVPKSIWDIPSLRHVCLWDGFSIPRGLKQKEYRTLSLYAGSASAKYYNLDIVRFLGQMTQLTTLSISGTTNLQGSIILHAELLTILENMPQLIDILLGKFSVIDKLPESHQFPQTLRSFTLIADTIKQDPLPVLETLQCLVVLKLKGYSGRTMSCSARGFPRLRYLMLSSFFSTEEWKIEDGAMPKLCHLELEHFHDMKRLPEGLLHLPSLKQLQLQHVKLISYEDDNTLKELHHKGCEVTK